MASPIGPLYDNAGIHCLYCGQHQLSPKEPLDSWTCNHCFSGLISFRLLNNLIPRRLFEEILSETSKKQAHRPCPICQKALDSTSAKRVDGEVNLELCHACRLFWFEGGAIVHLVRLGGSKQVLLPDPPKLGVRAPQKMVTAPIQNKARAAWVTFLFFVIASILSAITSYEPALVRQFGFFCLHPLRYGGATAITSLFLSGPHQTISLIGFLFFGAYAEKKLGALSFLGLCLFSASVSRFSTIFFITEASTAITGLVPLFCAAASCAVLCFPFREVFYPEQKWKSSLDVLFWVGIVGALFFLVCGLGEVLIKVLASPNGTNAASLLEIAGLTSQDIPVFIAAGVGLLWYFASVSLEKKEST